MEHDIMIDWLAYTLGYPEIAVFLSLALGYCFGSFRYKSLGLAAVIATLIFAVLIGQLGGPIKPNFFLMFLFGIGYVVGPAIRRASRERNYAASRPSK
jgi:putative transport protein